jgi:hypothetical protein
MQARLLELQAVMLAAQRALGEAEEDNRQLKRALEDEKTARHLAERIVYASNVYWLKKIAGGLDGPFCTVCWDANKKLIRMTFSNEGTFAVKKSLAVAGSLNAQVTESKHSCLPQCSMTLQLTTTLLDNLRSPRSMRLSVRRLAKI